MTRIEEMSPEPAPGVKLLEGSGVCFVQPDGDGYQPPLDYVLKHAALPLVLWLQPDADIDAVMRLDGVMQVRRMIVWRAKPDVRELEALTSLEKLTLSEAQPFDFSRLGNLAEVGGVWSPKWTNLERCKALRRFSVSGYKKSDLGELKAHPLLEEISLISPALTSLEGIDALPVLRTLEISRSAALESLEGVGDAPVLTRLSLSGCRKISDYEPLAGARGLESLEVEQCSAIPSLSFIGSLPKLRFLSIMDTALSDKSLQPCVDHPSLTGIAVTGRGYIPKESEVDAVLAARRKHNQEKEA